MLLSLNWLREFVPYEGTAAALGDRLTMVGLELDGLDRPFAGLAPIVVGHVVECGRHPEADKLSVTRVDVGDEVLDIVCGAPNVAQGQKVAVVRVGTTLPNGLTIKKAKLRGAPSCGMICSEAELGLSDDHDGIMVLDPAAPIGASILDVLKLNDEVLDISITPNRGDCLSVLGLARETAALYKLPLTLPVFELRESGPEAASVVSLEVADPNLCALYQGRVLEGAKTAPSPAWLRYRLKAAGMRAVSNLVDATNYAMLELGRPMHAFDLDKVAGGRVIVRGGKPGETLVTLDGQERVLEPGDIVIADPERAIGLGGVMGGFDSEITAGTKRIFLESAVFNPSLIRRTARRLGLHSEAGYRFERGVDQSISEYAVNRAAALMAELSGASILPGTPTVEPKPFVALQVLLRKEKAEDLLGIPLTDDFCVETLKALGCGVKCPKDGLRGGENPCRDRYTIGIPSHRPDLTREVDLIEELARFHGVDKIPAVLPAVVRPLEQAGKPLPFHAFVNRVKRLMAGAGLNEAINYSFFSHNDLDLLGVAPEFGGGRVPILNPLSDEQDTLRTVLAPGLLASLRTNLSQGVQSIRLFECAGAFFADPSSETTVREEPRLGILLNGARYDAGRFYPQGDFEYQDLKGYVEYLCRALDLAEPVCARSAHLPFLAPCVDVVCAGEVIGRMGRVKPEIADVYHAKKPVWTAELHLDVLYRLHLAVKPGFTPLPVYPPVRRDITLIAAPTVTVDAVLGCVESLNLPLLEDIRMIDVYEPKDSDEKNLTFRLTFRHKDRTLKDNEADKQRDAAVAVLAEQLGVRV